MNSSASIVDCTRGEIELEQVVGINTFELERVGKPFSL